MKIRGRKIVRLTSINDFRRHVDLDPNGCWIWKYGNNGAGYARTLIAGKSVLVTRLALRLRTGEEGTGRFALHICDNPECVNPDHLYWGTAWDNARDRSRPWDRKGA